MNPTNESIGRAFREFLSAAKDSELIPHAIICRIFDGAHRLDRARELDRQAPGVPSWESVAEQVAAAAAPQFAQSQAPVDAVSVDVREMKTSAGSDFYVCVQVGDRYLTPTVHREKWKADFEAAEWVALFNGMPRPDILAFGPESAAPQPPAQEQGKVLNTLPYAAKWKAMPLHERLNIHAEGCALVCDESKDAVLSTHEIRAMHDDIREAIASLTRAAGAEDARDG